MSTPISGPSQLSPSYPFSSSSLSPSNVSAPQFTPSEMIYMNNLNQELLEFSSTRFKGHVAACTLAKEMTHNLLLKIIRNSRYTQMYPFAVLNALHLLKLTGFCFSQEDLSGIFAPDVNLSGGIYIKTNFSDSCLRNANFTNSCTTGANFEGADRSGARFGRVPSLSHDSEVQEMLISPSGDYLLSADMTHFYVWNLTNSQSVTKIPFKLSQKLGAPAGSPLSAKRLTFSPDGRFIFATRQETEIVVLTFPSLEETDHYAVPQGKVFYLNMSSDGSCLVALSAIFKNSSNFFDPDAFSDAEWDQIKDDLHKTQMMTFKVNAANGNLSINEGTPLLGYEVTHAALSPTLPVLATVSLSEKKSRDEQVAKIEFWCLPGMEQVANWMEEEVISSISFTQDGQSLLIFGDKVYSRALNNATRSDLFTDERGLLAQFHFLSDERGAYTQGLSPSILCVRNLLTGKIEAQIEATRHGTPRLDYSKKTNLLCTKSGSWIHPRPLSDVMEQGALATAAPILDVSFFANEHSWQVINEEFDVTQFDLYSRTLPLAKPLWGLKSAKSAQNSKQISVLAQCHFIQGNRTLATAFMAHASATDVLYQKPEPLCRLFYMDNGESLNLSVPSFDSCAFTEDGENLIYSSSSEGNKVEVLSIPSMKPILSLKATSPEARDDVTRYVRCTNLTISTKIPSTLLAISSKIRLGGYLAFAHTYHSTLNVWQIMTEGPKLKAQPLQLFPLENYRIERLTITKNNRYLIIRLASLFYRNHSPIMYRPLTILSLTKGSNYCIEDDIYGSYDTSHDDLLFFGFSRSPDPSIDIRELKTGQKISRIALESLPATIKTAPCLKLSPDDRLLALWAEDHYALRIYQIQNRSIQLLWRAPPTLEADPPDQAAVTGLSLGNQEIISKLKDTDYTQQSLDLDTMSCRTS